jgi:hypothetical protein
MPTPSNQIIQTILYKWKPGLPPSTIADQMADIHSLVHKVPGLLSITGGPIQSAFIHPADPSFSFDTLLTFTWADDAAILGWNTHTEHARIGPLIFAKVDRLAGFVHAQS